MERSRHLYNPEQFVVLQDGFDHAWTEICCRGLNVTRDDLARNIIGAFDGFDGNAEDLAHKVLEGLKQRT